MESERCLSACSVIRSRANLPRAMKVKCILVPYKYSSLFFNLQYNIISTDRALLHMHLASSKMALYTYTYCTAVGNLRQKIKTRPYGQITPFIRPNATRRLARRMKASTLQVSMSVRPSFTFYLPPCLLELLAMHGVRRQPSGTPPAPPVFFLPSFFSKG